MRGHVLDSQTGTRERAMSTAWGARTRARGAVRRRARGFRGRPRVRTRGVRGGCRAGREGEGAPSNTEGVRDVARRRAHTTHPCVRVRECDCERGVVRSRCTLSVFFILQNDTAKACNMM